MRRCGYLSKCLCTRVLVGSLVKSVHVLPLCFLLASSDILNALMKLLGHVVLC